MMRLAPALLHAVIWTSAILAAAVVAVDRAPARTELPDRLPEAAPYVLAETQEFRPPYEPYWQTVNHPARCQACHERIFREWNGSMMANAWRDPAWRAGFLLMARQMSTYGNCDVPDPPDGTPRARLNPFAHERDCAATFEGAAGALRVSRPGSLVDGFCARCHMPTNYIDNVPLHLTGTDAASGLEHAVLNAHFSPTSDANTGLAFAALDADLLNTESGKLGVFCAVCHSIAETRDTPFGSQPGAVLRALAVLLPDARPDVLTVPDPSRQNLGYAVGSGSFRVSPRAIARAERLGPLSAHPPGLRDEYQEDVFDRPRQPEWVSTSTHAGRRHVLQTRAEFCGGCHDVSNPLPIRNGLGKWVGGFPIERTYTEWANSRYADRPGNAAYDPRFKRDCQTCHMQQDFGRPGTAQTLYRGQEPRPPLLGPIATDGPERTYFSHHFVGGNTYAPALIGAALDDAGSVAAYPELSIFSFTSADRRSPYSDAVWTNVSDRGRLTHHARLAWDRLRNVLDLELAAPAEAAAGAQAPLRIRITNSGSGHNFPTGFPEGRVAWLAVHAFDVGTGRELEIFDAAWNRRSIGVGGLTPADLADPNVPQCDWTIPAGSPDPYAVQFKAVATLGDGCPTLDLAYAHAVNLVTTPDGVPANAEGTAIDRRAPSGPTRFRDVDRDGDLFDDAFLSDTRLRPLPHAGAAAVVDRYAVVLPGGLVGPVAVVAAVYYQSIEAMVAKKLLGNLADTDRDRRIEPCVLGGACDGRVPSSEPASVEGAPPTPMEVRTAVIQAAGVASARRGIRMTPYPRAGAADVSRDGVVKITFSQPIDGLDAATFTLFDSGGRTVAASVDQIGDGTWGLFADAVFLAPGEVYTARAAPEECRVEGACAARAATWSFRTADRTAPPLADSRIPAGFRAHGNVQRER